ncbi:MAG TPA: D-tagatose-bisphosphate aldolase, class II, non-catalytic subunit [Acidimicrobiales bacterium]|nr:D-tagatose-bisphosphate aldolase, class II, non-catalytic subunit [Acidimicrobiales bacterium]
MALVVTLGEILVEIMAKERGQGFRQPLQLVGPFPSGAPAIFIDQVAKLGQPCGIIGCVGDDDFGRVNLARLSFDGVDVSAVEVLPGHTTGSAFVRYRDDGSRDFVYNIKYSASGRARLTETGRRLLGDAGHLHISGASLFSGELVDLAITAAEVVKGNGGSVSFDPNLRKEVMGDRGVFVALKKILSICDTFLPSGDELTLLTDAAEPDAAVTEILASGVGAVVVKRGTDGATYYGAGSRLDSPAYHVRELDPTGAGDCFDATFVTCRLQGLGVEQSLANANAAGAWAVTVRGPMEGTSTFAQLESLRSRGSAGHPTRALVAWAQGDDAGPVPPGITSVCSAHPLVLEAAMLEAASLGERVLIEATCNQVNHKGGYTGLTPADFRDLVYSIADKVSYPRRAVLLGGDHLGPNPWRHQPAEVAMEQAELMVAAYVTAGFEKLHLDASMGCLGEPGYVPTALAAERAARLAVVAQTQSAASGMHPRYVVGTEVPSPGGALEEIDHLEVTRPEALYATLDAHREAFMAAGAAEAYDAVMAVVAQPGVEFDDQKVVPYRPERASALSAALAKLPGLVFEAHSTDYQPAGKLAELVRDGFAVLKVGPGLTFALREALYGLDQLATALDRSWAEHSLIAEMERVMVGDPRYWQAYYSGDKQAWLRHYSYSDRIRYYWPYPAAQQAVERLFAHLSESPVPEPLISQFLPALYPRVASGTLAARPRELVLAAVGEVLRAYAAACHPAGTTAAP